MKITKYGHACVVVEEQGKKLVIDPGNFTLDFGDVGDIVAVVITHQHPDHFYPQHLETIVAANPDVQIFVPGDVAAQFTDLHARLARGGEQAAAAPFTLRFLGEDHATIHPDIPTINNIGVMVNDKLFYPGDSFTKPDRVPELLALPINAPWLKSSETIDYLAAVKPRQCFPTHNGLLSDAGHGIYNGLASRFCEQLGIGFSNLKSGESIEI